MSGSGAATPVWHSVLSWPLLVVVRLYRRWISPVLPATCRFYPSCSSYALTALQRFGPFTGSWLVVRRLCRCHPWNPGGVDHVPHTHPPVERACGTPGPRRAADSFNPAHIIAKDD